MRHFALVNTMARTQDNHVGKVLSFHKSQDAAQRASDRVQRATKHGSGSSSYLPLVVVEVERKRAAWDVYAIEGGYVLG